MMRVPLTIAIGLLTLATAAAPAAAQSPGQTPPAGDLSGKSLEALLDVPVDSVEGAARHTQRITEAPASVTVVTATDIETFGWRTLADVLKSVRGFHVTYDRNYSYVGVRAFGRPTDYNNRVLVMVDGRRINDSIYDGALIGSEFPLDLSVVERIEVIRGPGSALYGTSAFLAVVNVITKHGDTSGARQAGVDVSSFDTWNAHASHGWSDDRGRDVFLSVSRYDSHGPHALFFPEFAGEPGGGHGLRSRRRQEQQAVRIGAGRRAARAGGARRAGEADPDGVMADQFRRPAVLHARHARVGQRVIHPRHTRHVDSGARLLRPLRVLTATTRAKW